VCARVHVCARAHVRMRPGHYQYCFLKHNLKLTLNINTLELSGTSALNSDQQWAQLG